MMRARPPKVYSVAAGLLEPPKGKLHPEEGSGDLVTYVAYHEALEEFLGDPKHDEDPLYDQLLHALKAGIQDLKTETGAIKPAKGDVSRQKNLSHLFQKLKISPFKIDKIFIRREI